MTKSVTAGVTSMAQGVTRRRDNVTDKGVTPSRARRVPSEPMSRCHGVTHRSDSDSPACGRAITVTATTGGISEKHKAKLAADPRFGLWAAMSSK